MDAYAQWKMETAGNGLTAAYYANPDLEGDPPS